MDCIERVAANDMIDEFMGVNHFSSEMKYDTSWDWLMPVVEKIESIENGIYQVDILQEGSRVLKRCQKTEIDNTVRNVPTGTTKLQSVYLSAVQFIKYHNQQKTFYTQNNIGMAKYVVNFHDGEKTHKDGSPFFDIRIFKNKKRVAEFISGLKEQGYTARN